MARPLIVFPDAVVEVLRVVRASVLTVEEVSATSAVASRTMPKRDSSTTRPDLLVADDGDAGTSYWPVTSDALMRISVWDNDSHRAGRLARLTSAHLLAYKGDSKIRGFRSASRPFTTTDPDDATPLASFTIIARLKAE